MRESRHARSTLATRNRRLENRGGRAIPRPRGKSQAVLVGVRAEAVVEGAAEVVAAVEVAVVLAEDHRRRDSAT